MNENFYLAIIGSQSYGIENSFSDIDLATTLTEEEFKKINFLSFENINYHTYYLTKEKLISRFLFLEKDITSKGFCGAYLFPANFLKENLLTEYIILNRENIVKANLKNIYTTFLEASENFIKSNWNKRVCYSFLFLNILIEYATNNITFEEAIKNNNIKNFLMDIKNRNIYLKDVKKQYLAFYEKTLSIKDFYLNNNTLYLNNIILDLNNIMDANFPFLTE